MLMQMLHNVLRAKCVAQSQGYFASTTLKVLVVCLDHYEAHPRASCSGVVGPKPHQRTPARSPR